MLRPEFLIEYTEKPYARPTFSFFYLLFVWNGVTPSPAHYNWYLFIAFYITALFHSNVIYLHLSVAFQVNVGCFRASVIFLGTCAECEHCPCPFSGACYSSHGLNCCFCYLHSCCQDGLNHDMLGYHYLPAFLVSIWDCTDWVCLDGSFFLLLLAPCNVIHMKEDNRTCCFFLCHLLYIS